MKKSIFILVTFLLVGFTALSQTGVSYTLTADTLKGNETDVSPTLTLKGNYALVLQAVFDQLGGTSDGTITVQVSNDGTNWKNVRAQEGVIWGLPDVSYTIKNDSSFMVTFASTPYIKYRFIATGTSGDTTKITYYYAYKSK